MGHPGWERALTLCNDLRELERLRLFLEETCSLWRLDGRSMYRLLLICDELVTNAVTYGYVDGAEVAPRIEVAVAFNGERLQLTISDDGAPFDPLAAPAPDLEQSLDEREVGGLGIHFVRTLSDEVVYERTEGRNRLRLIVAPASEAEGEQTR